MNPVVESGAFAGQRLFEDSEIGDANKVEATKKKRQVDRSHITTLPGFPESYRCNICEKTFRNKKGMCYHDACVTGVKPYKCNICEKSFIKRSHFEYHERVHTGYKPFKCTLCDKAFPQKNKLNRHMISHKQEKQFFCQKCDKRYSKKEDLKSHSVLHTGLGQHVCQSCGKAFRILANLVRHTHTHSNERPYVCDFCKKSFKDKSLLIRHKKTHGKDKPFSCAHCNRFFLSKSELSRHLAIHTDVKPFSCTYCQTVFRRKDNLNRHIRHHHAENSQSNDSGKSEKNKTIPEAEDATSRARVDPVTVVPPANSTKPLRIRRSKPKKPAKPPEIISLSSVNSSSKAQPISLMNYRAEASRKDGPALETATINASTRVPIPIRRPGELSNAVPVINGPIMAKPRATDSVPKKKTFTYTEPIPLAEAVVINRRIEEKLYPQNSGSNLSSNYYFFRNHSTMNDSASSHVVHGNNSDIYNFNGPKTSIVTCNRVPILTGNKREILSHTRSIFSSSNLSSSNGNSTIREKFDVNAAKPNARRSSYEKHETEPKPVRFVDRGSCTTTESANSVPTIRMNNGTYLHEKRTTAINQTPDE